MRNLYIDFDGVVCNSIEVTYKMMEEEDIDRSNFDECEAYYRRLDWNEVLSRVHIINDAIECIRKIVDSHKFDVAVLTHVNSINEIVAKVNFISEYFPDLTLISVPKEISKTKMVCTKGAILIDDFPQNLIEWKNEGGYGVRFDLDMDGKGFPVIDRLDQILTNPEILNH